MTAWLTDPFWRGFFSGLAGSLIAGFVSYLLSTYRADFVRKRDAKTGFQVFLRRIIKDIPESDGLKVYKYYQGIKTDTLRELDRLWVFLGKSERAKLDELRVCFDRDLPKQFGIPDRSERERERYQRLAKYATPPVSELPPPHRQTLSALLTEMMEV